MRSKHYGQQRLQDDDGKPVYGNCRVLANTSLRKLMRATRQGKMPDERQVLIDAARERAASRADAYLNSSRSKSAYRSRHPR